MENLLKNNKVLYSLIICCLVLVLTPNVFALNDSVIYENDNGIQVSKNEYDIIIEAYGKDYFDNMIYEQYEWFSDLFVNGNTVEIISLQDANSIVRGTSHSTSNKKISIVKSCSTSYCTIVTTATWFTNPKVRSYDVIGARFNGTSLYSTSITTRVQSSKGIEYFNNLKQSSNGIGVSVKLPSDATNIIIDQKFYVTNSGTVFASYQHAVKNISLETSKLYTFHSSGEGGVFSFYGNALDMFDKMGGVNITL